MIEVSDAWHHAQKELSDAAASYNEMLYATLADLKATIIAPPDVEHAELVRRAASRRKPCNSSGDGYRDTLNWLTLLAVVSNNLDDQVIWVSNNSQDFGAGDNEELHEDLKEELRRLGAEKRVRWVRTLADLVLQLASDTGLVGVTDIETIQDRLQVQTFSAFISNDVLASALEKPLDLRKCALPTVTLSAKIIAIGEPSTPKLTVRGAVGDSEAAVEFSVEAETSIQVRYPAGVLDDSVLAPTPLDGAESVGQIVKPLRFRGLLTLDKYDRPTGGELTRITAIDDDLGFLQWSALDLLRRNEGLPISAIPPDFYKNLAPTVPADLYKNLFRTADLYKNLFPTPPADLYKNLFPTPPADLYKNLFPTPPADLYKNLFRTADLYKNLFRTADFYKNLGLIKDPPQTSGTSDATPRNETAPQDDVEETDDSSTEPGDEDS
jgi:DNA-binding transcriptional ArsR family regulator